MNNSVKIAVDAMGGDGSPSKIIQGIEISLKLILFPIIDILKMVSPIYLTISSCYFPI